MESNSSSKDASGNPETAFDEFEEWLVNKYQIFTIIGVFGALAVYFTMLPDEVTQNTKYGVAGCLMIFLLLTLLTVLDGMEEGLLATTQVSFVSLLYFLMAVGLLGAVVSVISILEQFWQGAIPLVISAVLVAIFFLYIGFIFVNNPIEEIEWDSSIQWGIHRTPYIAILLTSGAIAYSSLQHDQTFLDISTWDNLLYVLIVLFISHLLFSVSLYIGFGIVEIATVRLPPLIPNRLYFWRSQND